MINNLILSGGGIKGISLIGAIEYLHEKDYMKNIDTILGTSIGSIIGYLIIIGYTPEELYNIIISIEFSKLYDIKICSFLDNYGIDTCKNIDDILIKLTVDKGFSKEITFINLYNITNKKLIITTACLNNMSLKYFDYISNPNENVLNIIRKSISIPLLFCPTTFEENIYIDANVLDVFPHMNLLDDKNTLGLLISTIQNENKTQQINNIEDYLLQVSKCILKGITNITKCIFNKYTNIIFIKTININIFNFNIEDKLKKQIFLDGYLSTKKYFLNQKNI
jgi:NTE family protein